MQIPICMPIASILALIVSDTSVFIRTGEHG